MNVWDGGMRGTCRSIAAPALRREFSHSKRELPQEKSPLSRVLIQPMQVGDNAVRSQKLSEYRRDTAKAWPKTEIPKLATVAVVSVCRAPN